SPVSVGNLSCGSCHPDRWTAMNGETTEYHMYMQNSDTTPIAGGIGAGNKYPNKSQFLAGDKESEHRRCIMCHADMDVFHYRNNPNTPGVSYNLRVSINVAPDPGDPATYTNKDFDGTRADGGICFSCHQNQQTKNTDKMKNSGTVNTPAWNLDEFKASTHNYSITTTFKSDNSTFNATCVKCHTDTMIKDYQSSTYKVGAHSGTTRSYLANINKKATVVETSKNSLEENMCYQCHSLSTDGPDNYNPNGWDGISAGTGKDAYNQQTMNNKAQRMKFLFSKDSSHPIDGAPPYDTINGLSAAAGRHRVDEGVNDTLTPSGVQIANWNPAASRHVECMDCHNPHATNVTPRDMITWRPNIYHTTTTNYGSGANGRMSNYQVVEGSFGGQIGGANYGQWGVEPTYTAGTGGIVPTSFTKVQNMNSSNTMYQLCFKCHSIYSYGNTKPQIPWGTSTRTVGAGDGWGGNVTADFSWDPGQETDLSVDFNPYNYSTHPIVRRGRNQPAPHLNANWPFFDGDATAGIWRTAAASSNGRVSYNAATKVVTITAGRNFPTYYMQPGWKFQFTKILPTVPTAGTDNTYYYEIKTVDSATQVTLVSGPAANQTNVTYNVSAGLGWAFVPPYGPWSTLTCGDCHQSGDLADPAGPHGSDNPWILREINMAALVDNNLDGDMADTVDYINTSTGDPNNPGNWTVTSTMCYSCHRRDIYGATASANANSGEPTLPAGATSRETTYSRSNDGHPPGSASNESNPKHNAFGIWCLNCHGANSATGNGIGAIHGSNWGVGSGGTTAMGIRLRNGAASTGHTIPSGTSDGSCWTKSTTDSINGCNQGHNPQTYKVTYSYNTVD
ncbi:MAG: hypothetical protein OEV28_10410, partial [Nitrospirota bacterium]|nr:hypothetical protein [Nitrospirota bacterium]